MLRLDLFAAKAAHPLLRIDDKLFERWVDERRAIDETSDRHLPDLYLACGCAQGDEAALLELERTLLPKTLAAISRIRGDSEFVDETLQALRDKLLIAVG